jgi:hypothetical protein
MISGEKILIMKYQNEVEFHIGQSIINKASKNLMVVYDGIDLLKNNSWN